MPNINVAVIGPSDAEDEKKIACDVIKRLDRMFGSPDRHIASLRFETHVPAGMHPRGPQGLADERLQLENADYVVAVFKENFGTPVWDADSGTAHEIKQCYLSWKSSGRPVLLLFTSKSVLESTASDAIKIRELRDSCREVVWKSYPDLRWLDEEIMNDLGFTSLQNILKDLRSRTLSVPRRQKPQ